MENVENRTTTHTSIVVIVQLLEIAEVDWN